jgi:hypothetical protein
MNTLHLDHGREMRGGQIQALRLMRGLRERGHEVVLLARKDSPFLEKASQEGIRADVLTVRALRGMSGEAHVLHAHDGRSHLFAALLSRRPLVVSRRVIFPLGSGWWSRWKYSRASVFAAVSQAVAEELLRGGVAQRKIRVVYDGVPLLENSWNSGGPVVIPRSSDKGKLIGLAEAAARRAGAAVLLSRNLQEDLRGASVLVYLTASEGLGSAALLAMSAGIPVVASDVGGLKEFVFNGETGMRVENDVEAIANAIRGMRESPDAAREMGARARGMVASRFSVERMVTETIDLYQDVVRA